MPNLGFRVVDYSTRLSLGQTGAADRLWVVVPRRPDTLPPLSEENFSTWRRRDLRNFFPVRRNRSGDVVVPDVPVGTYRTRIYAPGYVPLESIFAAPMDAPIEVRLHRDATYPFGAGDTLYRGEVVTAASLAHSGFDVELLDLEPSVPNHRVPLNAKGQFVIFVPEKVTTGGVSLRVYHSGGSVIVNIANTLLHRVNLVPSTVVP